jgi:hypothetical protein
LKSGIHQQPAEAEVRSIGGAKAGGLLNLVEVRDGE